MANHIELIGNESRLAGKFRNVVDQTEQLQNQVKRLKLVMDESGASTADWTTVTALFGFRTTADASAAYALLNAAQVKLNSADVDNFVNRLG